MIDFGASLLATEDSSRIKEYHSIGPDKAKPFAKTHNQQIRLLKRVYTGDLLNNRSVDDILADLDNRCRYVYDCMESARVVAIKSYLRQRLLYYGEV